MGHGRSLRHAASESSGFSIICDIPYGSESLQSGLMMPYQSLFSTLRELNMVSENGHLQLLYLIQIEKGDVPQL